MSRQIGIPVDRRTAVGSVLAGAAFVLCWSSGFIGAKISGEDAAVTTVLMWRFLPLALLLAPTWLLGSRRVRGPDLRRQVIVGFLSQSGYLLTVYWAIGLGVSTGTTALVDGVQPLVAAALAGPLLGAAASGRQWIGLLIGALGVALATVADATATTATTPAWAYLVPLVGMMSLVAATFVDRRAQRPAPVSALGIHCATSAVVFTAGAVATGTAVPPTTLDFWAATAGLVVFATFGGYGLYWYLLDRVGVTRVNALMFLVPPVTTVWGALLFGEPFTALTAIGLALTFVAITVVTMRPRAGTRRDIPKSSLASVS